MIGKTLKQIGETQEKKTFKFYKHYCPASQE